MLKVLNDEKKVFLYEVLVAKALYTNDMSRLKRIYEASVRKNEERYYYGAIENYNRISNEVGA